MYLSGISIAVKCHFAPWSAQESMKGPIVLTDVPIILNQQNEESLFDHLIGIYIFSQEVRQQCRVIYFMAQAFWGEPDVTATCSNNELRSVLPQLP